MKSPIIGTLAMAIALLLGLTPPSIAYDGELYTVCKLDPNGDNFLAIRSCPSSRCRMLAKLPPGTFLWTYEPYSEKGWRHVGVMRHFDDQYTPHGPSGYVFDQYICYVDLSR